MKSPVNSMFGCLALMLAITASAPATEPADISLQRTQVIDLAKGWNAVYLEVAPLNSEPDEVFANLPVDMAAVYFRGAASSEQFITNPGLNLAKARGWGIWFSKDRPESFLSSLGAVYGQQAYLVHAKSAVRWNLKGAVAPSQIKWRPDAFNLVGFCVRTPGGPTFAEFFAGSPAHQQQPIYRLANDEWKKVTQLDAESMRSGESFWIYCNGASEYQGPLGVELPMRAGLILAGSTEGVLLRNQSGNPLSATVERVATGSNELPLSMVMTVYGDPAKPVKTVSVAKPSGPWLQALPTLEAGKAVAVPFECRAGEMSSQTQTALLRVTTDLGTVTWLPVYGNRPDLTK